MEINILKQAVAENQILVNNTIDTIFVDISNRIFWDISCINTVPDKHL